MSGGGDDHLIRGRDRRVLRDALRASEEALFDLDPAASGERKVTPEALARGLRSLLAGQIAVMEALLGAAVAPGSTKSDEQALEGSEGLDRFLGQGKALPDEAPAEPHRKPVSGPSAAHFTAEERAARSARFAARLGKGFVDDEEAEADAPPKLRPLTLDEDDDLSEVEAAEPKKPAPAPAAPASPVAASPATEGGAATYAGKLATGPVAAVALNLFPVEEINRWLSSGTVFQIRGAIAFLNMQSMGGMKVGEMSGNIRKMGFADELGKLEADGLSGPVLLFRRPEGS